jgi:aminopeptidase N
LDILLAAGGLAHPKARKAVREAVGKFQLPDAAAALVGWLQAGDASYLVEAETARALGATKSPLALDALQAALSRDSWNETIRVGVLDGLALLQDPRGIALAAQYLPARYPTLLRCAAIRSLSSYIAEPAKVLEALGPWTRDTSFRFAFNLASSLANLGDARAIALLQQVADRAVDGRVRKRAQEGIGQVRAGLGAGAQVDGLRTDVDGLRSQLRELAEKLDKAEQLRRTEPATATP